MIFMGQFPLLNETQRKQILLQIKKQQHKDFEKDFYLTPHGEKLGKFIVKEKVWNPFLVSSKYYASYLFYNNERLFSGKTAIDMGTGTGLLGVTMAKFGAAKTVLSDVSLPAVKNAKLNVKRFNLESKAIVVQGDLFENIKEKADFIFFNRPLFNENPGKGDTIQASMMAPKSLLERFLKNAPDYLNKDGIIALPHFYMAGETNSPLAKAPEFGYAVKTVFKTFSKRGLKKGEVTIHELKKA